MPLNLDQDNSKRAHSLAVIRRHPLSTTNNNSMPNKQSTHGRGQTKPKNIIIIEGIYIALSVTQSAL